MARPSRFAAGRPTFVGPAGGYEIALMVGLMRLGRINGVAPPPGVCEVLPSLERLEPGERDKGV